MTVEMVVDVIRLLLAIVWCVAAITKMRGWREFAQSSAVLLRPINSGLVMRGAYALPVVELSVALLLLLDGTALVGLTLSALLLWIFSVVLWRGFKHRIQVGCHCFGPGHADEITPFAIARTVGLAFLATVGCAAAIETASSPGFLWTTPMRTAQVLGVTLAAVCVLVLSVTALWLVSEIEPSIIDKETSR